MRRLPVSAGAEKEKTGYGPPTEDAGLPGHHDPGHRHNVCYLHDLLRHSDAAEHLPDADIHTGVLYFQGAEQEGSGKCRVGNDIREDSVNSIETLKIPAGRPIFQRYWPRRGFSVYQERPKAYSRQKNAMNTEQTQKMRYRDLTQPQIEIR